MTESTQEKEGNGGSKFANFIKGLLRLLLILIFIAVIGFALFFGGKMLYEQALVPIAENRSEMSKLTASQELAKEQVDQRLQDLNQRLTDLENQKTLDTEKIAELSSDIAHLQKIMEENDAALKKIDELDLSLQSFKESLANELAGITRLEQSLTGEGSPIEKLQQEVAILKAMELLSRARLYMLQNNYGLAREDIQGARSVLELLLDQLPAQKTSIAQNLIDRLNQVLAYLPNYPVMAADDLEIVWRSLANGLSEEAGQLQNMIQNGENAGTSFPLNTPAAATTLTPESIPALTKTITPTPTPTP